eukprot:12921983-Prorocentrum_lima.AAC.1
MDLRPFGDHVVALGGGPIKGQPGNHTPRSDQQAAARGSGLIRTSRSHLVPVSWQRRGQGRSVPK